MAVSEVLRHEVRGYFTELMDKERAAKVMEVIPAVDWADLATKQDLDHLREITELRFEKVDVRFEAVGKRLGGVEAELASVRTDLADLRAHLDEVLRTNLFAVFGFTLTFAGLLVAAAHLS